MSYKIKQCLLCEAARYQESIRLTLLIMLFQLDNHVTMVLSAHFSKHAVFFIYLTKFLTFCLSLVIGYLVPNKKLLNYMLL